MKLSLALFVAALPSIVAARGKKRMNTNGKISSTSKVGQKLLTKARKLNDAQEERDASWAFGYSIQFDSCHTSTVVRGEEGGGAEFGSLMAANSVMFRLCPTDVCGSDISIAKQKCGEYIVSMFDFVDAYTEYHMEEQEWECEQVRENCYYDDENQCYKEAGLDYCVEYEGQEEFEVQQYLECDQWEGNENYFIGPYCGDSGKGIFLGMFQDGGCAVPYEGGNELYAQFSYGRELPYSSESMVQNDCIMCKEIDRDNNNNNNNNDNNNGNQDVDILEMCEQLYETAAKCEENVETPSNYYYWNPDNQACDYIQNTLPRLDYASFNSGSKTAGNKAAVAFAWIFGVATVGLGGYIYWLHTKGERKVDLSAQEPSTVA